jgi:hypothetical protein
VHVPKFGSNWLRSDNTCANECPRLHRACVWTREQEFNIRLNLLLEAKLTNLIRLWCSVQSTSIRSPPEKLLAQWTDSQDYAYLTIEQNKNKNKTRQYLTERVRAAVTLQTLIREVLGLIVGRDTQYRDWGFSCISSVHADKFQGSSSIGHNRFLQNSLVFIITFNSKHIATARPLSDLQKIRQELQIRIR